MMPKTKNMLGKLPQFLLRSEENTKETFCYTGMLLAFLPSMRNRGSQTGMQRSEVHAESRGGRA
jgi:hypothetical protein